MNHGKVSKDIAAGLKVLRSRIEKSNIPPSKLDESINIATWNIREFGRRPRSEASIHFIAEILNQFDLIAITELRDNLTDLKRVMDILGPYWKIVFSDYITDAGGNRERFGYLYDKRAAVFTGLAAEVDGPRKKDLKTGHYLPQIDWWRKPYMASFRAGSFDFVMLSAHIRWGSGPGERIAPLKALARWVYDRRRDKHAFDKDFIVVGDFNIPYVGDQLYKAITGKGLKMPEGIMGLHGTNLAKNKRYDQILLSPLHKSLFDNKAGGDLDFYCGSFRSLYPGIKKSKAEFTYEISDHLPLWMQLNVDDVSIRLSQILRRRKK